MLTVLFMDLKLFDDEGGQQQAQGSAAGDAAVQGPAPAATPQMTDAQMQKVTETTAKKLAKQKKVSVKLYLKPEDRQKLEALEAAGKNPNWPFETVQVNGHTFQIQLGKEVEVPQTVAEILKQANLI